MEKTIAISRLIEGIPNITQGDLVTIIAENDTLTLTSSQGEKEAKLPLDRLTAAEIVTEREVEEKNKSSIGRAVAGGLLFGGVGAVVGAVSGIGYKSKVHSTQYFIINYINSDGEKAVISFEMGSVAIGIPHMRDVLNSQIKVSTESRADSIVL